MTNAIVAIISGICGAGIGAVATYFIMRDRMRKEIAEEMEQEFEDAKSVYEEKFTQAKVLEKESLSDIAEKIRDDEGYDYTGYTTDEVVYEPPISDEVEVISESEYSTLEDYSAIACYWYANDVVIMENGMIFKPEEWTGEIDVSIMLTEDNPEVYIRNHIRKTDILFIREEQEYEP